MKNAKKILKVALAAILVGTPCFFSNGAQAGKKMNARKFNATQARHVRNANRQAGNKNRQVAQMILDVRRMALPYFRNARIEMTQSVREFLIEYFAEIIYEPVVESALERTRSDRSASERFEQMARDFWDNIGDEISDSEMIISKDIFQKKIAREIMKTVTDNISIIIHEIVEYIKDIPEIVGYIEDAPEIIEASESVIIDRYRNDNRILYRV